MEAGKLRHRIEIQSPTAAQDTYGESTNAWATVATRWGSVEPLNGRELFQAQQVKADVSHRILLRYYNLTPKQRLKFDNRIFNIEAILSPGIKAETEVICREEV